MKLELSRKNITTIRDCLKHQIKEMESAFEKFPMLKNEEALATIKEALEALPDIKDVPLNVTNGMVFDCGEVSSASLNQIAEANGLVFAYSFVEKYEGKTVYVDKETFKITDVKDNITEVIENERV